MSRYTLSVDYGTTYSVAVVSSAAGAEILELNRSRYFPSLVLLGEDGELVVGRQAVNQAGLYPDRVCATPKREVGKRGIVLGGRLVAVSEAVAAVLRRLGQEAALRFDGAAPERVVLTHPAIWGQERLDVLREAARAAGLGEPDLVPEPVAAAAHYADGGLDEGARVAVYDLGGGTFDVAVLRLVAGGFEEAGRPGGDEHLGGEDFDQELRGLVEGYAAEIDPDGFEAARANGVAREWAAFREELREAKEALSTDSRYSLVVPGVADPVGVTRRELEELIEPQLRRTVDLLAGAIGDAGVAPGDLAAIFLTGGSSRIPLVSALIAQELGVTPQTRDDPKAVVALGAVKAARRSGGAQPGSGSPRRLVWCDSALIGFNDLSDVIRYYGEHARAIGLPSGLDNWFELVVAYGPRLAALGPGATVPTRLVAEAIPESWRGQAEQIAQGLPRLVERVDREWAAIYGVGLNQVEDVMPRPATVPIAERWRQVEQYVTQPNVIVNTASMHLLRALAGANWSAEEELRQVADDDLARLMRLWDGGLHGPLERVAWVIQPEMVAGASSHNPDRSILLERLEAVRSSVPAPAPAGADSALEVQVKMGSLATRGLNPIPGTLVLTNRRLIWKGRGATAGVEVPLETIAAIERLTTTDFKLRLRDGQVVRFGVLAWNRSAWIKAIEKAARGAGGL